MRRSVGGIVRGALVSVLIFLVAGEAITRAFDVVDRLSPLPRGLFEATDDPDLPYVLTPGASLTQLGVPVRVNALGLRGPETTRTPAPGVRRVLVIGDSATFGHELPAEQAFPAQLGKMLNEREPGRWEVLNAGVQGYDSVAEAAWLATRGIALAPETVVVGFNLNDYDPAPVLGERGILTNARQPKRRSWSLADVSEFYFLLRWLVATRGRPLLGGAIPPAAPSGDDGPWHPFDAKVSQLRKRYYAAPPDAHWRRMVDALRRLRDLTRRHGITLVVALLPDGDQVDVREPDLTPQRRLLALCDTLGVECLDLRPDFAAASHGEGSLFLDIMHPNAAGDGVIATRLAVRLLGHETGGPPG